MYIRTTTHSGFAGLAAEVIGPFEGAFTGTMNGDEGTKATITAELMHRDARVSGTIRISPGLKLKFPGLFCGLEPVDTPSFTVSGSASPDNPRHGVVTSTFAEKTTQWGMSSINITVTIVGDLSADGRTMSTKVTMKPNNPACGERTFEILLTRTA